MTILDKVIAAVTPTETPEERASARMKAREAASTSPWLRRVLDHHQQVEAAFAAAESAPDADGRQRALKRLATLLTGHSMAEEAVIYPAMALGDQKLHATEAYTEQSGAKVNLAALESMDPMSQDWIDKLNHVKNAVAHHVFEEESDWFPVLARSGNAALQARLDARYAEEFQRYMGPDAPAV
jgi:iron-sulfur cluster repair protein YtfE (RIC family)